MEHRLATFHGDSILCPFLRGRRRVLSKDKATSVEGETKTSTIPRPLETILLLLLNSSSYPVHETPWFIYVLSFILVERFCHRWRGYGSARGSRISFSNGEKDLSRWHAITILNIPQTVEVDRLENDIGIDLVLKYLFSRERRIYRERNCIIYIFIYHSKFNKGYDYSNEEWEEEIQRRIYYNTREIW